MGPTGTTFDIILKANTIFTVLSFGCLHWNEATQNDSEIKGKKHTQWTTYPWMSWVVVFFSLPFACFVRLECDAFCDFIHTSLTIAIDPKATTDKTPTQNSGSQAHKLECANLLYLAQLSQQDSKIVFFARLFTNQELILFYRNKYMGYKSDRIIENERTNEHTHTQKMRN